ncbi:unnamed protein product [Oikopleura dioica]|uniref:Uncharacterized protein n=1 Tax=Oikopleura dioica TaxID=34765 RepID=E4Y0A4_OIKDI|nr:unnamed protein product [Oikopleura dioica]
MKFFYTQIIPVPDNCVAEFGSRGLCSRCKRAYEESTVVEKGHGLVVDKVYCRKCASLELKEDEKQEFEKTDAKFKCPSEIQKCDANQLSYEEFYVGTCCENASRWTDKKRKLERLEIVNEIYKRSRFAESEAERDAERAMIKI